MNGEHIEVRPSWNCRACGRPWPCGPAREELAAARDSVALRVRMWLTLEIACQDMPHGPAHELFDRFLRWTG
jgi:hypothetical protein